MAPGHMHNAQQGMVVALVWTGCKHPYDAAVHGCMPACRHATVASPVAPDVKMQVYCSGEALHMASTRRLASCSAAMELRSPSRSPCRLWGLLYRLPAMSCMAR